MLGIVGQQCWVRLHGSLGIEIHSFIISNFDKETNEPAIIGVGHFSVARITRKTLCFKQLATKNVLAAPKLFSI